MTALPSFLQSLRDDPVADTPRLIFADWLQEQSDPLLAARGELLRVQCQLNGRTTAAERAALEDRQRQLLHAHRADWLGALPDFSLSCGFERGLVYATLEARRFVGRAFAGQARELLERAWVERVWLKRPARHLPALLLSPALPLLSGLDLDGEGLRDADLEPLFGHRQEVGLRWLGLANNALTDVSVARLLESPLARQLRFLDLRNNAVTETGARLLLDSSLLERLAGLELHGNPLPADCLNRLADWRRQRERLGPGELPRRLTNSIGMELTLIPAGSFWMGGGGEPGERQMVIERDFYLGIYPVTQQQWQEVMGSNPAWFSRDESGSQAVASLTDAELKQLPVEMVSWEDVQDFSKRLNECVGESGWVYHLPTEAEWEYSCRGGPASKQECSFHFYLDQPSTDLSSTHANFDGRYPFGNGGKGPYVGRPTKVGSYKPNRLGLYDMHGNVWEWTSSQEGSYRVNRGGSWSSSGSRCTAAHRSWDDPALRSRSLGFRLLAVPSV